MSRRSWSRRRSFQSGSVPSLAVKTPLSGGAADLQFGDAAFPLDPLQLELRHQRQGLVGGRHARVAARRKTLHAIKLRPGNRQPLLDLLELEPRRGQGHLEVLFECRGV